MLSLDKGAGVSRLHTKTLTAPRFLLVSREGITWSRGRPLSHLPKRSEIMEEKLSAKPMKTIYECQVFWILGYMDTWILESMSSLGNFGTMVQGYEA